MNCPNCNSPVPEGAAFCGVCGFKFQAQPQPQAEPQIQQPWNQAPQMPSNCPNCGTQLDGQSAFCPECGMPVSQMMAAMQPGPQGPGPQGFPQPGPGPEEPQGKAPKEKKAGGKKGLLIAIIAVLALLIIGAVVFLLTRGGSGSSGKKNDKYILYLKEGDIYYTAFGKNDPWQVTSRLFSDDESLEGADPDDIASLAAYLYITKDGKRIFYPDKYKEGDEGFTLYYRSMSKRDDEPVKIDSKIYYYTVNENESLITYINSANVLYQYDIKKGEKTKLASDVYSYNVTKDGSEVLYLNEDYTLYLLPVGGDKVKISTEVSSFRLTEDGNTILYVKDDGTFYKKEAGKDKEKIASDIRVLRLLPTGEAYYYTVEENEVPMEKFVKDDVAGDSSYDYYRERLKEGVVMEYTNTYYYFDGNEATELFSSYDYAYNSNYYYTTDAEAAVLRVRIYNQAEVKFKLSEIDSISWLDYDVRDEVHKEWSYMVVYGKDYYDLGMAYRVLADKDGHIFYQEVAEEDKEGNSVGYADIYKLSYEKGKFTTPELAASEADTYYWTQKDGDLYYIVDAKDGVGDYYVNDTKIDYDVLGTSIYYLSLGEKNHIYYLTDYNEKSETATVMLWDGSKSTTVADDVKYGGCKVGGGVTYLQDYSDKAGNGDLYWFHDGKAELIDDEVQAILPLQEYETNNRGGYGMY